MGAMAAITTPWTPEDDLVLKNAVEVLPWNHLLKVVFIFLEILRIRNCNNGGFWYISICSRKIPEGGSKRAIVRLEQAAYSCMQRAIASHGAFAVMLYLGEQHPTFLLIDLGREGLAKKVSLRQTIIKMERNGSFQLKNLGRLPVSVNSKEHQLGQSVGLQPNSLIEIQAISLIFDMNQTHVKRYLDDVNWKIQ